MSYILEALKKVTQKREQEERSQFFAFLGAPGAESKKRPIWPYLLIAVLLLNAGIMIWWLGPWRSSPQETAVRPAAGQPSLPKPASLAGAPSSMARKEIPASSPSAADVSVIKKRTPDHKSAPVLSSPAFSGSKASKGPLDKKGVVFFKDGTSEACDTIAIRDDFLHCSQRGGGSITNISKVDMGKTFAEGSR